MIDFIPPAPEGSEAWAPGWDETLASLLLKALDTQLDAVFAALPSGRLCYVNLAMERLLGRPREAILAMDLREIDPAATPERWLSNWSKVLREGSAILETTLLDRNGDGIPAEITGTRFVHRGQELLFGTVRDLRERRNAEEALRQSQKLESLGLLAGGIAHDFNNLLTAILGNLNLAQASLDDPAGAGALLAKVERAVVRASDLTRQMLTYTGKGPLEVAPQDLNRAVGEMVHLMQVAIPKNISLRLHLGRDLPPVDGDASQIQQVIMNLVTNAAEAIGEAQGYILVGTRLVELGEDASQVFAPGQVLRAGTYVVLDVSDTGCGMSRETQERIFDPFFSTKPSGRGLGLSAMMGILKGHKAGIRIRSAEGRGSTFELFFPAGSGELPPAAPWEAVPRSSFSGRILLVDDEEAILEAIGAALEILGLEVVRARDGAEAVRLFEAGKGTFDLVLMDLSMPRMDGRKAFKAIRALSPDVPVILSSGYDRALSAGDLPQGELAGFLQKPYRIPELRKALTVALERAGS